MSVKISTAYTVEKSKEFLLIRLPVQQKLPTTINSSQPKEFTVVKERQYLDFKLELRDLDEANDSFKVTVIHAPEVGEAGPVSVPYGFSDLKINLKRVEGKKIPDLKNLIDLGEKLADRLLPLGPIRSRFEEAIKKAGQDGGVRLRLLIRDPKLAQLPWEYSYLQLNPGEKDRRHFIVLNPQISIVRYESLSQAQPSLEKEREKPEELRLVAVTANVKSDDYAELDLEYEQKVITDALSDFKVEGVTLKWEPFIENATIDDLNKALLAGADLFHFAGHGDFKEKDVDLASGEAIGAGCLVLIGDKETKAPQLLAASELGKALKAAGVRVAVLGACNTGRRDGISAWTGVAPALIEAGIPAVVAMQYEVVDEHALAFSQMFYSSLALGLTIDQAVAAGRLAMLGKSDEKGVEWGVPVLYMQSSDGVIFPKLTEQKSETPTATHIRRVLQQTVTTIKAGGKVVGIVAKRAKGSFEITQEVDTVEGELTGIIVEDL
jgi:hypothetical protein